MEKGAAGDWGAILARDTFDASPFISTLPYICFSAAMVFGRLLGDRAAHKFGPMNLIVGGGLIAGIGLSSGLLVGGIGGVIFGWLAAGIGLSTVIPMLFSQAGEIAKINLLVNLQHLKAWPWFQALPTSAFWLAHPPWVF